MADLNIIKVRRQIRQDVLRAIEGLTSDQMTAIPGGASNNILWNIGHVLYDQYNVLYRVCGLPDPLPQNYQGWFDCGTSPRNWTKLPDVRKVTDRFRTFIETVVADYEGGRFSPFNPYQLDDGTPVDTIQEAILFDALHEASHYGVIITLRRLVASAG